MSITGAVCRSSNEKTRKRLKPQFILALGFHVPWLEERNRARCYHTKSHFERRFIPYVRTSCRTVNRIARPLVACRPQSAARRNLESTKKRHCLHLSSHTSRLYHRDATFSYPVEFRAISGSELLRILCPLQSFAKSPLNSPPLSERTTFTAEGIPATRPSTKNNSKKVTVSDS